MSFTRREFIKTVSFVGGAIILGGCELFHPKEEVPDYIHGDGFADPVETTAGILSCYTVCAMCEGNCGIRARVKDGWVVKIDGNPYHPNSREPHIAYSIEPADALTLSASTCVKGQSGVQTLYDPYRVRQPLKRVGPRGSGVWRTVSWEQALDEIVNGGNNFGDGSVRGLSQTREGESGSDRPPEFGPAANGLVLLTGRLDLGARTFLNRFMGAYGSVNGIYGDYTQWDAARRVGFQLCFDVDHDDLQPDILNCRYLVSIGSSPLEAGNPMQAVARKTVKARFGPEGGIEAIQDDDYWTRYGGRYGALQWVVVDPRLSESASKAQTWIPIKPGAYAALAYGMIRRLLDTGAYRQALLENTCRRAARRDHESVWTDATYLVRLDSMTFMRPEGAREDEYMVFDGTGAVRHDSVDRGVLETEVVVGGVPCKTVFTLLKERAFERTMADYADMCGVEARDIEKIADAFAEHAPQAVAELGETAVNHVNGTDAARAVTFLNLLVGNLNRKGGLIVGGVGSPAEKKRLFALMEDVSASVGRTGIRIDRTRVRYEDVAEHRTHGFPARRQWFPFIRTFGNVPEVLPSIAEGYPYPVDAVILYHTDPVYEAPGIRELAEATLQDRKKIPLLVAIDTQITESARFADYILPDTTYLERWDICEVGAAIPTRALGVRRPVVGYLDEKTGAYVPVHPQTRLMEDIFIDIAKRCNLPGFGKDALGKDQHLECAYHFYRRMTVAAVSGMSNDGVPQHEEKDAWDVVTSRGGVFEAYDRAYVGDQAAHRYEGLCHFYAEELAATKNALTGRPYDPLPHPGAAAIGGSEDFPLQVVSYRLAHQSMMRTTENRWILELLPENYVLISSSDARRFGVRDGDTVKVESPHGAVKGRAVVRHGVRPGVIGVPYGYANRYLGAQSVKIDGTLTEADHTRGKGITVLPISSAETGTRRGCRQDPISGNVAVNDTRVKLSKT